MKRRDFLKLSATGVATLVLGSRLPGFGVRDACATGFSNLEVTITDAVKEMMTHNAINTAECYFWTYKMKADGVDVPVECPGPFILMGKGDSFSISITNNLDEPHSFYIPGIFDSGPIAPGATFSGTLTATASGCHLYYDNLNEPVNRVMGLHGAFIVRPNASAPGHKFTPYDDPTPHVQALYDDFGNPDVWPGLAWEQGDAATNTPPFRQYCWITHQASPRLFAEVGNYTPGLDYPAQQFMQKFLRDPFSPTRNNNNPQYFTINGQSGFFAHFSPTVTPMGRVGEPCVVHIMNAGLWTHSMHMHCNHFYVTRVNGVVQQNPIWVDVFSIHPMDKVDYTIPFMRSPDVPNERGIGRPDTPLNSVNGRPVWPPFEELDVYFPGPGQDVAQDINGNPVDLKQRQSPLCYPMHDHSEPSQTSQGGTYNCGLISGMYLIGDRNAQNQGLGDHMDFPMDEDFAMMFRNIRGCYTGVYPAPGSEP